MGERERVEADAGVRGEQLPRAPLLHRVAAIARHRLAAVILQRLRVAREDAAQAVGVLDQLAKAASGVNSEATLVRGK